MNTKEIKMVPFSGGRFLDMVNLTEGKSIKSVAAELGCGETTLRRAIHRGRINEKYLEKIPSVLGLDIKYFTGEDGAEVAKAVKTILAYLETPEE